MVDAALLLFFCLQVKEHRYVLGNEACRPIIIDTLRFLYDLEMIGHQSCEVVTPEIARPRIPHEVMFAIGGWSGGSPTAVIETYDTRADRWIKVRLEASRWTDTPSRSWRIYIPGPSHIPSLSTEQTHYAILRAQSPCLYSS